MNRLPHIAVFLAAILLVAADKKPEKAKEQSPSAAQIQLWVKQLGDESFQVREEATQNLIQAGGAALDAVTKATKSDDAEVKQRALMIIKQIKNAAAAYFKKLGGKVTFDEKKPGKPVIVLSLRNTKVTDAGLVHLKVLSKLKKLDLRHTKITDTGLVHLKGLTNLRVLCLNDTKVTLAGFEYIKKALPGFTVDWGNHISDPFAPAPVPPTPGGDAPASGPVPDPFGVAPGAAPDPFAPVPGDDWPF